MASKTAKFPYWEVIGKSPIWWQFWKTYMYRLHLTPYINWKGKRYYLHIFFRPDEDRDFHDHPWGFKTTVLFGGYDETSHVMTPSETFNSDGLLSKNAGLFVPSGEHVEDRLGWLSVRTRPATHAHRITKLHTWFVVTLVERDNTRGRQWGFWTQVIPGEWKWVRWEDYLGVPHRKTEAY